MNVTRVRSTYEIFCKALQRSSATRSVYLDEACGENAELRQEVEALLAIDEKAAGREMLAPLSRNLKSQMGQVDPDDPLIGRRLGSYQIKRRIGAGGMGNVYLAARVEDFKQLVAVKVLKRGMDTQEVLRRFRTEIHVQAALSKHPNIAGLLDAGTTEDGLPYCVMEYVDGERIDRYCDRHRLTVAGRLELFQSVCAAVQFAHQHAVIHRDLKPGNILVTPDGTPKLIDFGIVKLINPELSSQTVTPTRTECRLLTPEYASPEQARGESVTTASDVYSLGVVLYELLCGHRPHDVRGRSITDVLCAICEVDPEKPSAATQRCETLSSGSDTMKLTPASVATARSVRPPELRRLLAGDLDNIVLQALRKEPQRRYATVDQFASDIDRYLDGLPVAARPIGTARRVWRWCQRNPLAASLFIALLLGSLFGLLCLSHLSHRLVRLTALDSAAYQAELIQQAHNQYSNAADELKMVEPKAGEKLKAPATFTIELGNVISQGESGMHVRLYSDRPFRTRPNGGPADHFQREALRKLREDPSEPLVSFEDYQGRSSIRYAIARVMDQKCVACHNTHPDRPPGVTWKVGDVRGVLEVTRPLDADMTRTTDGLRSAFVLIAIIFGTMLALSAVVLVVGNRRHRRQNHRK